MPYVIVDGKELDQGRRESLATRLTEEVASLFGVPKNTVLLVVHSGEDFTVMAGGQRQKVALDITVEGAGIAEGRIAEIVKRLTDAAVTTTGRKAEEVLVLVKIPGGPHMRMTDKCAGIGGKLLGS